MIKLKLKNILSELLKEIGETHPVHKNINDKLLQIAKRGSDAEERENIKGKDKKYQGNPDKGNKVLNRAKQKDIDAILNGTYGTEQKSMNEDEGTTNIFSKHPYIKDMLNAIINTDGTVELQVYKTKGGLPIKQTSAIPLAQFTPEYVEKHTSQKYDIDDKFRQGIQQFVDSVQNKNN